MKIPTRVLALAGDALDDVLVRRWAAEGVLPTFQRLLGEGTWATTLNPIGLYVGALWPSFATGASPARHGPRRSSRSGKPTDRAPLGFSS